MPSWTLPRPRPSWSNSVSNTGGVKGWKGTNVPRKNRPSDPLGHPATGIRWSPDLVVILLPHHLYTTSAILNSHQFAALGDRQNMFYLPRGFLGLIVMSYFGKVADRSNRAFTAFISPLETFTLAAYVRSTLSTTGCFFRHVIRNAHA